MLARLRRWAAVARREVLVVWLGARDPRVPWLAKVLGAVAAGYALSPIDLIPDFIPVLGYVDDLVIVPLLLYLALRLIPPAVRQELRAEAARRVADRPSSRWAAVIVVVIWLVAGGWAAWWLWAALRPAP
ncbi:MAG: YkvA family protein [Proteobacteria bacterium]|nr:YkvA family protein [Pseudomonadota bacterium]MDA1058265.1 YkvA family protein [Pseudomonadota bacterium]